MSYNLLVEPWIPVLWSDGRSSRVGIRAALTEAGRIRQIAASNPIDNVALLRLLLAVLQWCRPDAGGDERRGLDGAAGVPDGWVTGKLGPEGEPNPVFDLLGSAARFFQHEHTPANQRPIGDLLHEFPTETKIAHFRHVRDGRYGLCPACCAMGIVRFSTFANAYGGGRYTSAVNGPAPAYALPQGATLLHTLLLNWPEGATAKRDPPWLCERAPGQAELDIVTVLAWRSRRIWLGDPGATDECCSYCGRPARLIKRLAFTGNWKPPFQTKGTQKKFWDQDPHLVLEAAASEGDDGEDGGADEAVPSGKRAITTLGFPAPGSRVGAHARFWRRVELATLSRATPGAHGADPSAISVAGPAVNKGLYQDAAALLLPVTPSERADAAFAAVEYLDQVVGQVASALRRSTPNPQRQHPNRRAVLDAQLPALETWLREEFADWLGGAESAAGDAASVREYWRDRLAERLPAVVEGVVLATTFGSPLRRQEAVRRARQAVNQMVARLAAAEEKVPAGAARAGPKRGRRKRGRT